MEPTLTDTLCTHCGLCCDGTLFADVELAGPAEATPLAVMGLRVDDENADGLLMLLPCAALRGRRCSVYAHRPACCRSFECRLLRDARRGAVSVAQARASIAQALALVQRANALLPVQGRREDALPLGERVAEALRRGPGADAGTTRRREALARTYAALERLVRDVFLGRAGPRDSRPRRWAP